MKIVMRRHAKRLSFFNFAGLSLTFSAGRFFRNL